MDNLTNVISSFKTQEELEPKIWEKNGEEINPKVRKNLLDIAYQFIDSFGLDVFIDDIIITGSIANYNWSKYSDIDLHILVNYEQFSKQLKDLYIEFFDLKKIVFNQKRNIKMFGYDVELYVEDSDKKGVSDGVYSLMQNKWIKKPIKEKMKKPNVELVKSKAKQWMRLIDNLLQNIEDESPETIRTLIKKYKDKLKKYRVSGLEKGGEMSIENLVFKVLRRNGYIEKLYNLPTELIDKKLSLSESVLSSPLQKSVVSSPFGAIRPGLDTSRPHPGVDLQAPSGTELYSPADGVVTDAGIKDDACGGTIAIMHDGGYRSRFCHLKRVDVSNGQKVERGQRLGLTGGDDGDIGRGFSTGAHLHYELQLNGVLIDPMDVISDEFEPLDSSPEYDFETQLQISSGEADSIREKIFQVNPGLEKNNEYDLIDQIKQGQFISEFEKMIQNRITFGEDTDAITQDENTENIQIALQFLGYLDKDYGIDGFYDDKTINAVKDFKEDYDLPESSTLTKEDLLILFYLLVYSLFEDEDLYNIQREPNYSELKLTSMKNFYELVLIGLQADITINNLNFLRVWNDTTSFEGAKNPFGLKFDDKDLKLSVLEKTIKILKEDGCLTRNMRMNKSAEDILECEIFDENNLRQKIQYNLKKDL